ncbi:uncharacterized protein LOC124159678 [Ischnura elegans]|uniref:uncharacterized protein LOC124159678 n=1 Tax=Ischnura elegans TaxID=197161 RepID=UPI001ED89BCD|nr:uncharacterized protein LOC124159678 [Ischnura elegans]
MFWLVGLIYSAEVVVPGVYVLSESIVNEDNQTPFTSSAKRQQGVILYSEPAPHPQDSNFLTNPGLLIDTQFTAGEHREKVSVSTSPVRKRPRNEVLWKRNVNKTLKNLGQPYTSCKGKECEGAKMRDPCACRMDCVHKITEEERHQIHNIFWQLGVHTRQWEFIRVNSLCTPTKHQPGKVNAVRKVSRTYFFNVKGNNIVVCKQMFMRTLGICDSWIDSAYNHINPEKGFTLSPDKRGGQKKGGMVTLTLEKIDSVRDHVNKFPRIPSHYCRKRTKREYLQKGLSISKMSRLYAQWAEEIELPKSSIASQRQYRDIVNKNFNIGFYMPKKDQCSLCSIMRNINNSDQAGEDRMAKWTTHLNNKKRARQLKEKDKADGIKDKTIAVCSFDLQKQLPCPKSENSVLYYRNKLNIFNFTIFNMVERVGDCYLWHEGIGKKGSNEISSSLLNFLECLVKKGYRDIRLWSDNCAGQNKNRFLFAMYEYIAIKYSIKITHRYLEPGHTQMEVDSIHARIEKETEKMEIFDFNGWVEAIEEAKQAFPKYRVKQMDKNCIFTFKSLVAKQNWDVDTNKVRIQWKKVKEVTVNGNEGNLVKIKYDFDSDQYVTLCPNKKGHPINLKSYVPPVAYESNIPLSQNTVKDLTWLCDNLHVPVHKQAFIRSVLAHVNPVTEDSISDMEFDSDEELCLGNLEEAKDNSNRQLGKGVVNDNGDLSD